MNKEIIIQEQGQEAFDYIEQFVDIERNNLDVTKTSTLFNIRKLESGKRGIINLNKINDIKPV